MQIETINSKIKHFRSQVVHEIIPPPLKSIKRKNTQTRMYTAVNRLRNRIKGPVSAMAVNRPGWVPGVGPRETSY